MNSNNGQVLNLEKKKNINHVLEIEIDTSSHTCNKRVSIECLEFIKFTAIYNSGNDLQSNQ